MSEDVDVEKQYNRKAVAAKLHRLADALEQGKPFQIQISGQRVRMPANAIVEMEYQREGDEEEIEIEVKWQGRPNPRAKRP